MEKFNPEKFDPSNPEYKKVEDLPRAFKDDFIETEDKTGFVKKEADEEFLQATRQANQNIKYGKTEGLVAVDVLHKDALDDEKFIEEIINEKIFKGIMGEKNVDVKSWKKDSRGIYEVIKGVEEKNITNELYEKGILFKRFFERLADAGVEFVDMAGSVPNELLNDEEFLLKLAKNTSTKLYLDFFSERIQQDNDFLFRLVEVGGSFYFKDREEIIKNYFTGKDSATVAMWLVNNDLDHIGGDGAIDIYKNLPESLKENKDIVRIFLEKDPDLAVYQEFLRSLEVMDISLEILKKMPTNEHIVRIISIIEKNKEKRTKNYIKFERL